MMVRIQLDRIQLGSQVSRPLSTTASAAADRLLLGALPFRRARYPCHARLLAQKHAIRAVQHQDRNRAPEGEKTSAFSCPSALAAARTSVVSMLLHLLPRCAPFVAKIRPEWENPCMTPTMAAKHDLSRGIYCSAGPREKARTVHTLCRKGARGGAHTHPFRERSVSTAPSPLKAADARSRPRGPGPEATARWMAGVWRAPLRWKQRGEFKSPLRLPLNHRDP